MIYFAKIFFSSEIKIKKSLCFLKNYLKSENIKKKPNKPKIYRRRPKKYKKLEKEENKKSYVRETPDKYEKVVDAMEKYGSAKDLFAHAFSYGKRHRRR